MPRTLSYLLESIQFYSSLQENQLRGKWSIEEVMVNCFPIVDSLMSQGVSSSCRMMAVVKVISYGVFVYCLLVTRDIITTARKVIWI
ncbi:hypothetical protein CFII68_19803 [Pseudomonas sp. CFII68]|nr:hypothetical protein CFII68_19803 [Pseudomonas sp. CFII68]